jgi:hypothetical protein
MASIINAGTTTATALNVTTDTTGAMVLQTSGVNAISISSSQVVTFANPVNTTGSAGSIANTGGWAITPSGTKLYFSYNGANVASMDSSGNFKSLLTVAAGTTP